MNRCELELVCGLPCVENGPLIWFGFATGRGQTQAPNLRSRIMTPEPVGGLPVSAPTSESEGHRYRDGSILYKERVKCRDKPVVERAFASENHRIEGSKHICALRRGRRRGPRLTARGC